MKLSYLLELAGLLCKYVGYKWERHSGNRKTSCTWKGFGACKEDLVHTKMICGHGEISCTWEGLCAHRGHTRKIMHMGMIHIFCTQSWKSPGYSGCVGRVSYNSLRESPVK